MTGIDKRFCEANALSCGAIQNLLEKAPGLVFVNGEFRHKYTLVPPSPPPDPSPPPRAFAYAPHPPLPPPPPVNPPPFYEDAEDCLPLPRLADYGLDITTDAIDGAETEERASCVFARRVLGTFEPLTLHTTSTRQNSCAPSSAPTPYPELDASATSPTCTVHLKWEAFLSTTWARRMVPDLQELCPRAVSCLWKG